MLKKINPHLSKLPVIICLSFSLTGCFLVRDRTVIATSSPPKDYQVVSVTHTRQMNVISPRDAWITTKVKTALLTAKNIPAKNIHVSTYKGIVHLSGFVFNKAERTAAQRIVYKIKGVTHVQNHLLIASSQKSSTLIY